MPAVKLLFQEIARCNDRCMANTGDIDPAQVATIIESALATSRDRPQIVLCLANYIASAMTGAVLDHNHL